MTRGWGMTTPWNGAIEAGSRALGALLFLGALLLPAGAAALKHGEPIRIGALTTSWGPTPEVVGLRDGLVALGYQEDEHFDIGVRFTSGDKPKLSEAARKLVEFGVDVIFAVGTPAAMAAQGATENIPIVFVAVGDPVRSGLVESYARPGGNTTGVADNNTALAPKRLEMFKLLIPRIRKVLFVYDSTEPGTVARAAAYRGAGARLGISLVERVVQTEAEARAVFATVENGQVDGLLAPELLSGNIPGLVVETAVRKGIPSMFGGAFYVDLGGLASYGPGEYSMGQQAARLVKKIMRGVSPAEIPVEVNNDIEFTVNLKTAKALGLKIPPEVLYRATRIVR